MANQKDIKRRILSINNIMQITNAMQLVASAKLRKLRKRLDNTRPYFETVFKNINEILASVTETTPIMKQREVKKRAIIVIASDKGLAGGYNINVVNLLEKVVKDTPDISTVVYTTGIRSIELLKRRGFEVNTDFTHISADPLVEDAQAMGEFFTNKFLEKDFDEVLLVYTKFISLVSFKPEVIKLLPASGFDGFEKENNSNDINEDNKTYIKHKLEYEFEPSINTVLTQMIRQYINVTVYGALLESSVSEQASRSNAMENATTNGEELVGDLQLEYNRARQAAITQEITEIVGGAEALN